MVGVCRVFEVGGAENFIALRGGVLVRDRAIFCVRVWRSEEEWLLAAMMNIVVVGFVKVQGVGRSSVFLDS